LLYGDYRIKDVLQIWLKFNILCSRCSHIIGTWYKTTVVLVIFFKWTFLLLLYVKYRSYIIYVMHLDARKLDKLDVDGRVKIERENRVSRQHSYHRTLYVVWMVFSASLHLYILIRFRHIDFVYAIAMFMFTREVTYSTTVLLRYIIYIYI
jgi:hypothetical protein